MGNEYTKLQIRTWLKKAVKEAQNPSQREKMKRLRKIKKKKMIKNYGF